MKKHAVIVANGTLSESLLPTIREADMVIGVDRAAFWLLQHDIVPHAAVGDFDSVTPEEFGEIEKQVKHIVRHPARKDWTDTELAAREAIKQKATQATIVGGVGTRVDHLLGVLHVLDIFVQANISAVIQDEYNLIQLQGRGRTILKRGAYKYISLIPYTETVTVSLEGFLYPLSGEQLFIGQTRGISNELIGDEGVVTVHDGKVLVIQSRD